MRELLVRESEHTTVEQAHSYRVPGYLIVQPKAACTCVSDLSAEQASDLFECLVQAESLVRVIVEPERLYVLKFGEENPQVHFHIIPRTEKLAEAYLTHVPDGRPYNGAKIVAWTWQNHASLGYSDEEIGAFVQQARETLRG